MMNDNKSKADNAAAKKTTQVRFLTVPTKTYDGGTVSDSEPAPKKSRKPVRKQDDPFLYYSNQETRMNAMLLRNDDNGDEAAAVINDQNVVRMTRISFELHPSLVLEDLFLSNARLNDHQAEG